MRQEVKEEMIKISKRKTLARDFYSKVSNMNPNILIDSRKLEAFRRGSKHYGDDEE